MTVRAARPCTTQTWILAEGPLWDPDRERLLWIDIEDGLVLAGEIAPDGTVRVVARHVFDERVASVQHGSDGGLVVVTATGVVRLHPDGSREAGPRILHDATRRLNDAAVSPEGVLVTGSLALTEREGCEALLAVTAAGTVVLDDDIGMSNGIAWSTEGRTLFHVDSGRGILWRRSWRALPGGAVAVGERQPFATVPAHEGIPDGIAVDVDDGVWIALWGGGGAIRLDREGRMTDRVDVDAPHASSVCLGGPARDTLFISTARRDLSDERRRSHPHAGGLFSVAVDVPGRDPVPLAVTRPAAGGPSNHDKGEGEPG